MSDDAPIALPIYVAFAFGVPDSLPGTIDICWVQRLKCQKKQRN
jgi:hypothetical protein